MLKTNRFKALISMLLTILIVVQVVPAFAVDGTAELSSVTSGSVAAIPSSSANEVFYFSGAFVPNGTIQANAVLDGEKTALLIIALYLNDRLIDFSIDCLEEVIPDTNGLQVYTKYTNSLSLPDSLSGMTVKGFLWSKKDYIPIAPSIIIDEHSNNYEVINLVSSVKLLNIGENGTAIFNAAYIGGDVSLTLINLTTGNEYLMIDNADVNNGDDIAGDGVYSVKIAIDTSVEKDYIFIATSNNGATSNQIKISVIKGITEEDIDDALDTIKSLDEKWAEILEKHGENNDAAKVEMFEYIKKLETLGYISDVQIDQSNLLLILFTHPGGILGGFFLESFSDKYKGNTNPASLLERVHDESYSAPFEIDISKYANTPFIAAASIDEYENTDYVGNNRAVVLSSFASTNTNCVETYQTVAGMIRSKGFEVQETTSAKISDYHDIRQYGTIIINSHGQIYNQQPTICLEEIATKGNMIAYKKDIEAKNIAIIGGGVSDHAGEGGRYWILPNLIEFHHDTTSKKLPNSLVYLGFCSYVNASLSDAFLNSGAGAVIGYTGSVSFAYDKSMVLSLVNSLLTGNITSQALSDAITTNGEPDPQGISTYCRLAVNSNGNLRLITKGIVNGSFEHQIPFFGWNSIGDARIITSLMELSPQDRSRMAIISTGLGSVNDSTSILSQHINVASIPKSISFKYNWVSEEPMEWVNRSYNDQFIVELVLSNGSIYTILKEDIDTNPNKWIYIPSINFPDGDNTCYHTGWKTVIYNIGDIPSDGYNSILNEGFEIRFTVFDVGDSLYDSAALLDDIKLIMNPA